MIRSRSSNGLLPTINVAPGFPRPGSHTALGLVTARRRHSGGAAQRALAYLVMAALLGGCVWSVARLAGRGGGGDLPLAAGLDGSLLGQQHLSSGAGGGAGGGGAAGAQQHQQQQHLHEDVHDRQVALEQLHQQQQQQQQAAAGGDAGLHATAGDAAALQQSALELEHVAELQRLGAEQARVAADAAAAAAAAAADGVAAVAAGDAAGAAGSDPLAAHVAAHIAAQQALPARQGPSLYAANLSAVDIRGNILHTADLAGKVTIVVNVASQCGYTDENYVGLHRLYERYKDYGLQVLAFPCNQFGQQEPGSHAEIEAFVAAKYGARFPLMCKVEVNGPSAHPLFAWLKQHTPAAPGGAPSGADLRWNFEKFLVDKGGHPVQRYPSPLAYHDFELDVYNELIRP